MKKRQLIMVLAAALAVGGWWLARSSWRSQSPEPSIIADGAPSMTEPAPDVRLEREAGNASPSGPMNPGHRLRPPDPARRFMDFTPEQRVEFARRGHGPGG